VSENVKYSDLYKKVSRDEIIKNAEYSFWILDFGLRGRPLKVQILITHLSCFQHNNMLYFIGTNNTSNLYYSLYENNPSWSFHADGYFSFIYNIVEVLSPKIFFNPETNLKIPILWYFVPIYILTTILVIIFCIFFDKEGTHSFYEKIKNIYNLIKQKIKSRS
jgi:hypothetical protein